MLTVPVLAGDVGYAAEGILERGGECIEYAFAKTRVVATHFGVKDGAIGNNIG